MKNFMNFIQKHYFNKKVMYLLILCIVYTLIYFTLDDSHFSGVNKVEETIKDEVLKKNVDKQVSLNTIDSFKNKKSSPSNNNFNKEIEKDIAIDKKAAEVQDDVEKQELDPSQIQPSLFQQIFNRFYFAITTGCLLGYGDIYPITNISKFLSLTQSLMTVSLILS